MTRKLKLIPDKFNDFKSVKEEMENDFNYRFNDRQNVTKFGRPLYERINVQIITTQACPFKCSFCLERQNPTGVVNNFDKQIESLKEVIKVHPNLRLSITGGELMLYPDHIENLISITEELADATFISINTTGKLPIPNSIKTNDRVMINISDNSEVHPNLSLFENKSNFTIQTIFEDSKMSWNNVKSYMDKHPNHKNFSFKYLINIGQEEYNLNILNDICNNPEVELIEFRIGDFFMNIMCRYNNKKFRITFENMTLQQNRQYKNTYSNIIINPEGEINVNWNNNK